MRRKYPYDELDSAAFEELVIRVCAHVLGTGTFSFAMGPDGGRDGRFTGTACKYPSPASPLNGKFIIQAKWTNNPAASCSDREFARVVDAERARLMALAKAKELNHYLMFTNRKKPANKLKALEKKLKPRGVTSAAIVGVEELNRWLDMHPTVWESMQYREAGPFKVNPTDLAEVVLEFGQAMKTGESRFNSEFTFNHVAVSKKNKINGLTSDYDAYIRSESLPYFSGVQKFLQEPRNSELKALYHDTADDLKQKIIVHKGQFENFDQVLLHVSDVVIAGSDNLRGKKRYVRLFLHYMYWNCDIGLHAHPS